MPYVAISSAPIRVRRITDPGFGNIGGGADPGYDHPSGGHPDQGLPGGGYPSHGLPGGGEIDNTLPYPPPGVFPPPVVSHPIVPAPPGTPPGTIWPPVGRPPRPSQGLPGGSGGRPDNTLPGSQPGPDHSLPGSPARPDNTLPGSGGTFWIVAGIPGYGWRYICVDPSLVIDNELPSGPPARPDNTLPETPTPRSRS